MSIYATYGELWLPVSTKVNNYPHLSQNGLAHIYIQAVPAHIDDVGDIWEWLPPPVSEHASFPRAVFFTGPYTTKSTERNGQEHVNPILVITGKEYVDTPWPEMFDRLCDATWTHVWEGQVSNALMENEHDLILDPDREVWDSGLYSEETP